MGTTNSAEQGSLDELEARLARELKNQEALNRSYIPDSQFLAIRDELSVEIAERIKDTRHRIDEMKFHARRRSLGLRPKEYHPVNWNNIAQNLLIWGMCGFWFVFVPIYIYWNGYYSASGRVH